MILQNQQAVPRLQIHRFVHDYLLNFCIEFSCFFMFFSVPISGLVFNRIFDGKRYQNDLKNRSPGRPFRPKRLQKGTTPNSGSRPRADLFSGIVFFMFFDPLSAPFWSMLGPFGSILAPFGIILVTQRPTCNVHRSILDAPGSILNEINRIWNRSPQVGFSQRIWSQNEQIIKPTHHKETNP